MADKKYLDQGGLTHLWDKIKSYLTTWKASNFGTGTYSNSGTLTIGTRGEFQLANNTKLRMDSDTLYFKSATSSYLTMRNGTMQFYIATSASILDINISNGACFAFKMYTSSVPYISVKNNTSYTVKVWLFVIGSSISKSKTAVVSLNSSEMKTAISNVGADSAVIAVWFRQ